MSLLFHVLVIFCLNMTETRKVFSFQFLSAFSICQVQSPHRAIMRTCPYHEDPLHPFCVQENWGLPGYTFFFILLYKIDCGYTLEQHQ